MPSHRTSKNGEKRADGKPKEADGSVEQKLSRIATTGEKAAGLGETGRKPAVGEGDNPVNP